MWLQAGWTLCLLVAHPALVAGAGVFDDGPNGIPTRSNLDFLDRLPSPHIVLLNTEPLASAASPVAPAFAAAHPRRSASAARAASAADAGGAADAGSAAASGDASRQVAAYRQQLLDQQAAVLRTLGVQPPLSNGAASAASAADGGVGGYSYAPPGGGGGGPRVTQQYTAVVNGFSVSGLSDAQAAALRALPGVASVTRAGWAVPLTVSTPAFLGLSGPGKAWERHFGGPRGAGADVLVGVIDSGISTDSLSYAAGFPSSANAGATSHLAPGACSEAGACTAGKLVACRYFQAQFVSELTDNPDYGYKGQDLGTCEDFDGHGSHTSSTAAGNGGVAAVMSGSPLVEGGMSGMAPGAAVAMYKVLWYAFDKSTNMTFSTASTPDIIAAVEAAVLDGVDVINFSLGFQTAPSHAFQETMYAAFKAAAEAGVLVVAAGGNDGAAGAGTVQNNLPFIMTVAAGTHDRVWQADAIINGAKFTGSSAAARPAGPAPLYYAGEPDANGALCLKGALSGAAAGKIVLCKRGSNLRTEKSAEVARAGGVGMILFNTAAEDTTESDLHSVPTVHVTAADGAAILALLAAAPMPPTASITARRAVAGREAPFVAGFSGEGPAKAEKGAYIKPDVLAPGVSVFAAFIPASTQAVVDKIMNFSMFDGVAPNDTGVFMSGTSMAAPHVTGLAALVKAKYPSWSPSAIKSAIMTSASQTTNRGNKIQGTPLTMGAGHIDPARALDPGLVYDAGPRDYNAFACAAVSTPRPSFCNDALCGKNGKGCAYPQALRDLNLPSIAFAGVRCTTVGGGRDRAVSARRRVTVVAGGALSWSAAVEMPDGFKAKLKVDKPRGQRVQRSTKSLQFGAAGDTRNFTLTITTSPSAPAGWHFGSLVWSDGGGRYSVRSPIAIQCVDQFG